MGNPAFTLSGSFAAYAHSDFMLTGRDRSSLGAKEKSLELKRRDQGSEAWEPSWETRLKNHKISHKSDKKN